MTDTPTVEQLVKHMTERFLSWRLPVNFSPDNGIAFNSVANLGTEHQYYREPIGTNLFDYTQAKAMVEHMLEGSSLTQQPRPDASVEGLAATIERLLWHVEQVCGPVSTDACVLPGDDDLSILRHNFMCELAALTTREAVVEACAKLVEKRRDDRFNEHGIREWDTNACYYEGDAAEIYEALDEEAEELAAAIRALAAKEVE